MTSEPDLRRVAAETVAITRRGEYRAPSGRVVSIAAPTAAAIEGTRLYRGDQLRPRPTGPAARVEVTGERTGEAAARLVREGAARAGLLNFANAVHPGGGFLHGSRAQEESLCRCSALYACLTSPHPEARAYYREQEEAGTALALDHVLVSPAVPFFRAEDLSLLEQPFLATVLTAAAPDLGWLRAQVDAGLAPPERFFEVPAVFERRTRGILAAAAAAGVDELVLGAWGCGAFGNDPELVAASFAGALAEAGAALSRVVFAVWDPAGSSPRRAAFDRHLRVG